jgi:RNA polymerase sigma-70 factor (ECF subfamily)
MSADRLEQSPELRPSADEIADLILGSQRRLYSYILTLLPNPDRAWDILQQTNMVLWRDSERFRAGTEFMSWAFRVAYFQVLADREKQQRDRLRFNNELFEQLTSEAAEGCEHHESRLDALRKCLGALPNSQRILLHSRYGEGLSVSAIAESRGQSAGALSTTLHRIRRSLLDCIERRLAVESGS